MKAPLHNTRALIIIGILILLILLSFAATWKWSQRSQGRPLNNIQTLSQPTETLPSSITLTATQSGQTALALLQLEHTVTLKQYDFGAFIEAIDGVAGTPQFFWALYKNDQKAQVGADQLKLQPGDTIKFVYEAIE